jgi:hypothetical protein
MNFVEIEWELAEWIQIDQYREWWRAVIYTIMNLRVP